MTWAKAWKRAARKNRIQAQTWQALAVIAEGVGQQLAKENTALRTSLYQSEKTILTLQRAIDEREIEAAGVEARGTAQSKKSDRVKFVFDERSMGTLDSVADIPHQEITLPDGRVLIIPKLKGDEAANA